jgi:hypothetical protein
VSRVDGQLLSETFVELTDTMVADFDVIDFLHLLTTPRPGPKPEG